MYALSQGGQDGGAAVDVTTGVSPFSEEEKIAELLRHGMRSLEDDRLLIPRDNSAYYYFRQALRLDPGNSDALEGIGKIVARYTVLATAAFDRSDNMKADKYIKRGLSLRPHDENLLVLRDRLSASLVKVVEPVPVVPVPAQEPVDYFSRLKDFFTQKPDADNQILADEP